MVTPEGGYVPKDAPKEVSHDAPPTGGYIQAANEAERGPGHIVSKHTFIQDANSTEMTMRIGSLGTDMPRVNDDGQGGLLSKENFPQIVATEAADARFAASQQALLAQGKIFTAMSRESNQPVVGFQGYRDTREGLEPVNAVPGAQAVNDRRTAIVSHVEDGVHTVVATVHDIVDSFVEAPKEKG